MNWLNRAEGKYGHLALEGLPRLLVAFNALVFVLYKLVGPHFLELLVLDTHRIMHGEVWRLVTYLFIPSLGGLFGDWLAAFMYLMFLWFVGNGLEQAMGAFKFNVFYLCGMLGTTVAACLTDTGEFSNGLLNGSMFFAFARFYPEVLIYVLYILPVKVKWMAWILGAYLLLTFVTGNLGYRLVVLAASSNYLLFFGAEIFREARHRSETAVRKARFDREIRVVEAEPLHQCVVCGRTEATAPDLHFRVAQDGREYCLEHLPPRGEAIPRT